jgi:hypothetical protein
VRLFKKSEAFLKHLKRNVFFSNVRHFERLLSFLKTFSDNLRLLIISLRLFEDISRKIEASIRKLRLFQRLKGFLKTFSVELRLF